MSPAEICAFCGIWTRGMTAMSVDRHAVPNFMMCDSKCVRLDVHGMGQINLTRRKRIITINTLFVFFPLEFFCFFFLLFLFLDLVQILSDPSMFLTWGCHEEI